MRDREQRPDSTGAGPLEREELSCLYCPIAALKRPSQVALCRMAAQAAFAFTTARCPLIARAASTAAAIALEPGRAIAQRRTFVNVSSSLSGAARSCDERPEWGRNAGFCAFHHAVGGSQTTSSAPAGTRYRCTSRQSHSARRHCSHAAESRRKSAKWRLPQAHPPW